MTKIEFMDYVKGILAIEPDDPAVQKDIDNVTKHDPDLGALMQTASDAVTAAHKLVKARYGS